MGSSQIATLLLHLHSPWNQTIRSRETWYTLRWGGQTFSKEIVNFETNLEFNYIPGYPNSHNTYAWQCDDLSSNNSDATTQKKVNKFIHLEELSVFDWFSVKTIAYQYL